MFRKPDREPTNLGPRERQRTSTALGAKLVTAAAVPGRDAFDASERERPTRWTLFGTVLLIIASTAAIAGLAWVDLAREEDAIFDDFAREQVALSSGAAGGLTLRMERARRDASLLAREYDDARALPTELVEGYEGHRLLATCPTERTHLGRQGELTVHVPISGGRCVALQMHLSTLLTASRGLLQPGEMRILFAVPGYPGVIATDGQQLRSPSLEAALARGASQLRLSRPEALALGLPERIAYAGIARSPERVPGLGSWSLVVVTSARRLRDRQWHAQSRQVLSVLVGVGLVVAVGALALRNQRKELELSRRLALERMSQIRDERLARASRAAMMGTLATGVAHELGTPLGVIATRLEQLHGRLADDERAQKQLDVLDEQVDHIARIIRGFLDLARGEAPALAALDAERVVRSAQKLVEHRFLRAEVTLRIDVPDELPGVAGDALLLEHALVNMLLNACEACDRGGHVELSVQPHDTELAFIVLDDGVGISADDAARATEPFFTTKSQAEGTGLGLAITQEIAHAHRGSFAISPAAPKGTRAVLSIPIADNGASSDVAAASRPTAATATQETAETSERSSDGRV